MDAVRVQCGCGNWLRFDLPDDRMETKEKSCWKCNSGVKARREGDGIKGYRKPVMTFGWMETNTDVSQEAL